MYWQESMAWKTPLPLQKQQVISFNVASRFGHLKPISVKELAITNISEIFGQDLPNQVTKHTDKGHVELFRDKGGHLPRVSRIRRSG